MIPTSTGAAIRGGDLICKGSVGARTGIDMKGGTIIIGGDAYPSTIKSGLAIPSIK